MQYNTKFVGLDVSKDDIAVAIADARGGEARYYGKIEHTPEAVRKLMKKLGQPQQLVTCYEAGPTGYELYRLLKEMGIRCMVVAPTLIPVRVGDRVKTDRRDAVRLAQLLRAGELQPVWVPDESHEALRDLTRAREDAKEDQHRARQRLLKFLLRHGLRSPAGVRPWSRRYREWLDRLIFDHAAQRMAFQEYLRAIDEIDGRLHRLEAEIHIQATEGEHAAVIQALQTMRGVAEVTATTLVAEIGYFSRFEHPKQLMAYAGLVPSEYSSGGTRRQGRITKTGNAHVRRVVVEAAWSYRYPPAVKGELRKRQEGQQPEVCQIAWKAQDRLYRKRRRLIAKGKNPALAATAIARELLGFVWAIACHVERNREHGSPTAA